MNPNLDLSPFSVRTDLAVEAREIVSENNGMKEIPGIKFQTEEEDGMTISRVEVLDMEGARTIGKLPGKYLTFEIPGLRRQDSELQNRVATRFAKEFHAFLEQLGIQKEASALVVGLGNWNVTADAIGPMVVENLLITRHLFKLMPDEVDEGYRPVSAISPGVLGITGIETSEIVLGVVQQAKPDFVIAIDALAARSLERVNTTIQVSDTGINPGSGVGNKRKPLNKETLGVPVISVGIPTVVDAATIVHDAMNYLLAYLGRQVKESRNPSPSSRLIPENMNVPGKVKKYTEEDLPEPHEQKMILGLVGELTPEQKRQLIGEVLSPMGHNLIVTPKEVDDYVEDIANVVANGLNAALHSAVNMKNVSAYTH